jgi:hypothetical protein
MEFEVHYIKNHDFKTIQGNGIFGGLTNSGQIDINFFTERGPIPKKLIYEVEPETGEIKKEIGRESKNGIIREVHLGVLLDAATAKSIIEWLQEKVDQIEKIQKEQVKNVRVKEVKKKKQN